MGYLFDSFDEDLLCGVDEAGRGPLAGPVVAAAVIFKKDHPIEHVRDSKKLNEHQRNELEVKIKKEALCWAIGIASVEEIDSLNILQATFLAMKRAVEGLNPQPDFVLVDGNRLPRWNYRSEPIIGGDDIIPEISAASILAKTYRDRLMLEYAKKYPQYGFEHHMGYGTKEHLEALEKFGVCEIHRKTFRPVTTVLTRSNRKGVAECS